MLYISKVCPQPPDQEEPSWAKFAQPHSQGSSPWAAPLGAIHVIFAHSLMKIKTILRETGYLLIEPMRDSRRRRNHIATQFNQIESIRYCFIK